MKGVPLMRSLKKLLSVVVLTGLCAGVSFGNSELVVPGGFASVEGGSSLGEPFNNGSKIRYQQVYASSEFAAFGGPMWIHGVAFRSDWEFGQAFSQTYTSLQIDLSTTSVTPSTIGQNYASNVGIGNTTVLN